MKGTAYLFQGALISLWWLGLALSNDFFAAFQFPGISKVAFNSFLAPDILVITSLSVFRAYKPNRDIELIILGGFAYGSFYCLNASLFSGGGYLPTTIMLLGLFYNIFLVYESKIFRESNSKKVSINAFKTILQIISVWSITLILFPLIIIEAFQSGIEAPEYLKVIAGLIFLISSSLGLLSAYFLVKKGDGTPLPVDQTKKLVICGPYKYVRNPMAVAGMGQGFAVALFFSSLPVLVYTVIGGFIWHYVVRPIEEKDMLKRFGDEYLSYNKRVKLWIPKF